MENWIPVSSHAKSRQDKTTDVDNPLIQSYASQDISIIPYSI